MRKFIKKLKNSLLGKILKFLFKIIKWAIEILVITIAIVIVTQRATNNEKAFLGFRIFNVATGSMEPEYAVGDILISKEKDPKEVKVGENIVYLGVEGGYEGKIITHNVIKIEKDENGKILFHTKGRANTVEDPIVSEDQLYGVVVQNNVVLAWLCKILTNRYGLYFFVIIPIILYAFVGFVRAQEEKIEQEKELEHRRKEESKKRKRKQMEAKKRKALENDEEQDEKVVDDEEQEKINDEVENKTDDKKINEKEVAKEKTKTQKKSTTKKTTKKKKAKEE